MTLADILNAAVETGDGLAFDIPESWMQGRTSYGGLSSALALHSARTASPDLPALRTAQVSFVGPLAGRVTARATLLRRGRTAAFIRADVISDAGLGLAATFVFTHEQPSHIDHVELPAPFALPEPATPTTLPSDIPSFVQNFDVIEMPRIGADWTRWVRLKQRDGLDPMTEIVTIGDALPPAALALAARPGPISSMTWLVNLLTPAPKTRDGWWLLRSTAEYTRGGSSSQTMAIWNADGTPIASGMQSVALFM
jgi:acyl-CoA thioesterase